MRNRLVLVKFELLLEKFLLLFSKSTLRRHSDLKESDVTMSLFETDALGVSIGGSSKYKLTGNASCITSCLRLLIADPPGAAVFINIPLTNHRADS